MKRTTADLVSKAASPRAERLVRLALVLDQLAREHRTLDYLGVADAIGVVPPHRIHQVTRLLEMLMKEDFEAGRPIRSALVVSRARGGLPAPGFFDRARRLGLMGDENPQACLERLQRAVFSSNGHEIQRRR